jgi:hypothetical protein
MIFHHEPDISLETKWYRGELRVLGPTGRRRLLIEKANRREAFWAKVDELLTFSWLKREKADAVITVAVMK